MAEPALLLDPIMAESKPARSYLAKALPASGTRKFYGQFAWPGLPPELVQEDGIPVLFDTESEAELEAALAMIDGLNNRPGMPNATRIITLPAGTVVRGNTETVDGRKLQDGTILDSPTRIYRRLPFGNTKNERYQLLTGPEFSMLLAEAGITPTFFAWLNNNNMQRVMEWLDGTGDDYKKFPPHSVRVLLEIFRQMPETIDIAEAVTEAVTTMKSPKKGSA